MRIFLGFDFGLKRIGIATGQELTGTAQALTTVFNSEQKPDWLAIEKLINEWKPDALVVGVPYHMDGSVFDITLAAQKFGRQLNGRFNLTVYEMDERLSSREAEAEIARQRNAGNRKKTQKGDVDKMAAQIILQSWLQQQEHSRNEHE